MRHLEKLLALGYDPTMSERLCRKVRISNAFALIGAIISVGSFPFDLITAPTEIVLTDVVGLAVFTGGWLLNARRHVTASRLVIILGANLVIGYSTCVLGEASRQATVFFALATSAFFVFDFDEPLLLGLLLALPIVGYFLCQELSIDNVPPHSVAAYRVYAPLVAFGGLAYANIIASRTNRRAEEALAQTRARAVTSARMAALGEMAGGIAHEFRNPLAALSLANDQLIECKRIEDVGSLAERSKRITSRITKIIEGLTSFARDASADPFVAASVEQIIGDTLELCRRRFAAHNIELSAPTVPPTLTVECRPSQISQILLNLLNNAHDAAESAAERWVRLEVAAIDDHVELSVEDSGPGIPVEMRHRIFEPFFTTKEPGRGTGLGLSVSRGLAEAHHGALELVEYSPHTKFVLRIPKRQPQ